MFIIPKWWGYYLISMPASLSGPQDHLHVLWFARRTHKTYSSDLLRHSEKAHGTKSEEARPRSPGSHTGCPQFLQHRIMTTRVKYCIPRKLLRNSVPSFYGGWSHGHPLPSMSLSSRLPEEKQIFQHKAHCFHKPFRRSETFLSGNGGNPPETQVPRVKPMANLASRPF